VSLVFDIGLIGYVRKQLRGGCGLLCGSGNVSKVRKMTRKGPKTP
jgi:hypothetical protein